MFWARWRCFELGESWHHFFPGIFYIFLKFSLFVTDFFCLDRWNLLCQPSLRNHGHYLSKGLSQSLLTYRFKFLIYHCPSLSLLFVLVWKFFLPESSLAQLFTSVNGSLLFATQPVLFLKRLLSTGVVKRQHLHSTRCRVFLPWAVFCQLSTEYALRNCCFFSGGDHCEIWLSMALCFLRKRPINEDMFYDCASFFTCKYLATFKTLMERNTYFCSRVNGDILRSVSYRAGFSLPVASFCTLLLIHCRSLKFFF